MLAEVNVSIFGGGTTTSTRRYNAILQRKWYLTVLKLRVGLLLTFSVYISCLYSGFITAAQLSRRPTRQRLDAFVVCTPQQTLRVLLTRSRPYLTSRNCYKMRSAELQLFIKIYNNSQYLLQKHNLLPPASAASQHYKLRQRPQSTLQSAVVWSGHLIDSNLLLDYFLWHLLIT